MHGCSERSGRRRSRYRVYGGAKVVDDDEKNGNYVPTASRFITPLYTGCAEKNGPYNLPRSKIETELYPISEILFTSWN